MPPRSSHVSWMTIHVPSVPVREVSMCVFLRSDTPVGAWLLFFFLLHVWCGYYSRVATIRGRCLFLWKAHRHQQWLDKVHVRMSDTVMTVTHFQ